MLVLADYALNTTLVSLFLWVVLFPVLVQGLIVYAVIQSRGEKRSNDEFAQAAATLGPLKRSATTKDSPSSSRQSPLRPGPVTISLVSTPCSDGDLGVAAQQRHRAVGELPEPE